MTCKELILDLLCDYLDGALGADAAAAAEAHFQDCPACLAYLRTYRKTRELTGKAAQVAMPDEMKTRLRQFLLDHLT